MNMLRCLCIVLALGVPGSRAGAASLESLGTLPLGLQASRPHAVSPNASVIVGVGGDPDGTLFPVFEASIWRERRISGLGDLTGGDTQSQAFDVSDDGSVIVGLGRGMSGVDQAVRWIDGVIEPLATFGDDSPNAAYGVSADGTVIVGQSTNFRGSRAFRLSEGVYEGLGDFDGPSSFEFGAAFAVSPDGSIVVGWTQGHGTIEAFRWQDGQLESLGYLAGCCPPQSRAFALSPDGAVVVGESLSGAGFEAFRWSKAGMVGLGDLPGGAFESRAWGVSGDGAIVVGTGSTADGKRAFWWDPERGMRLLSEILASDHDIDVSGWTLHEASGLTADGCTIVGQGRGPDSHPAAFIASLCEIEVGVDVFGKGPEDLIKVPAKGKMRVMLLGAPDFDPATVDLASVRFGRGRVPTKLRRPRLVDFDRDGDLDLKLQFPLQESALQLHHTELCVTGRTRGGTVFRGCDSVQPVDRRRDRD